MRLAGRLRGARSLPHAHRKHALRAIAGRRPAGARRDQRQAPKPHGTDQPRGRVSCVAADDSDQIPALSQRMDLAASRLAVCRPRARLGLMACLSSGWAVARLWLIVDWRLAWPAVAVLVVGYAVTLATFPDEPLYVATYWLHGSTYLDPDTGEVSSDRPNWYAWITWPNTLDLHGEDLIDDIKFANIVKENEGSIDVQTWEAPRWVATLSLGGRNLVEANFRQADVRHVDFSDAILNRADLSYARGAR